MNLAIASTSATRYSETFIQMQLEALPCALRIHGRPVATETVPGGKIDPLRNPRGLLECAWEFGLRGRKLEGPRGRELARRLRRAKIQVLLANFGQHAVSLAPICRDLGIAIVPHFHGFDAHRTSDVQEHADAYRQLGAQAAAVIAVSHVMVDALSDLGIPREKIQLVRYGADPQLFPAKESFPSDPLFFGVGRFVDKKAPHLTILAFREVVKLHPNARLVLAGDGDLWESSQNICEALGLGEVVEFPGRVSHEDVGKWFQRATAFVQHSIEPRVGKMAGDCEGTPVAVIEAMMSGLPIVSTRHTGIAEVVQDGESGLLVNERDVAGMAAAMNRLAADPALARRMGGAARVDALKNYTAEQYLESLTTILNRAEQPT